QGRGRRRPRSPVTLQGSPMAAVPTPPGPETNLSPHPPEGNGSAAAPIYRSQRARRTADQPISYFMQQAVENPRLISLAAGLVDPISLPTAECAEAFATLLNETRTAQAALQYGTTQGYAPLREKLLARTVALDGLTPQDLALTVDDVIITTGSQQLL